MSQHSEEMTWQVAASCEQETVTCDNLSDISANRHVKHANESLTAVPWRLMVA